MSQPHLLLAGTPTGAQRWRAHVAATAADAELTIADGVTVDFALDRWVDLDTLVTSTLGGLRDAKVLQPRYAGLDVILATKRNAAPFHALVSPESANRLIARPPPGSAALQASTDSLPRAGNREAKRAWRNRLAACWAQRPLLDGDIWVDVTLGVSGSILGPLEVALDALEPVVGRDPRGRSWQEFFPNDHRITWLRVRRGAPGSGLAMSLGEISPSPAKSEP